MARTTVSIPEELRARMVAVGDEENWSRVATQAFESAVNEIEDRKGIATMTETIERLSATKEIHFAKLIKKHELQGRAAGRSWAEHRAGYTELLAIANMYERDEADYNVIIASEGYPLLLARVALGDESIGWSDAAILWGDWLEDDEEVTGEFAFAFAEGAAGVFDEVEDKLS